MCAAARLRARAGEEEIRALWNTAHQRMLPDETWLAAVLARPSAAPTPVGQTGAAAVTTPPAPVQPSPPAEEDILQVLNSFLDGCIGLKVFNATFQQRTHRSWNVFYLRGMSGGLFFNQLVQRVPNDETFAHLLRLMLHVPEDRREAKQRMQAFVRFLEGLITSQQVKRAQLQPARVPFFQSIWWHIQAQERWPIFYGDVRRAILPGYDASPSDPIESYFSFCTHFLALAQELGMSSWELEHLCRWSIRQDVAPGTAKDEKQHASSTPISKSFLLTKQSCVLARGAEAKNQSSADENGSRKVIACRTHLQWLLAKIGHKVGCQVWIAGSDHHKACNNERLGKLSLPSLPILADSTFRKVIGRIDVLWLLDQEVIAAYEIEQACTDVTISLLRLSDLKALFPDRQMNLCLVAPHERFEKVQFELSRPIFHLHGMQHYCALISEELLLEQEEHILRWATSPAVINDFICHGNGRKPCALPGKTR